MEGKIQNTVLPSACNSGLSSCHFSVLHPSLDFQFILASVHPVSYRPFEAFTRWCLLVSPKGSFVMSSLPMSQAISCHPVITEVWVQSQAIPCWICDGHSSTQSLKLHQWFVFVCLSINSYIHSFIHLFVHSSITNGLLSWQLMIKATPQGRAAHGTVPYTLTFSRGYVVAQFVEALFYKVEGRRFDSHWYHWNLSLK